MTHIELQLTDDKQNNLVLNGGEFSLTVTIHFQKAIQQTIDSNFLLDKKQNDEEEK